MLVAHLSDLHLGAASPGDLLGAERLNSFRRGLNTLLGFRPDVVLIAGDTFDSPQVDAAVVEEAAKAFAVLGDQAKPVPAIVIPGNHDPADAGKLWTTFQRWLGAGSMVQVVLTPQTIELAEGKLRLECYPCPTRYSAEAPWEKRLSVPTDRAATLRVILAHGTLQGGPIPEAENDAYPFFQKDIDALGADYVALGHFHGLYPAWPNGEECRRSFAYCGTHEPDQFSGDAGYAILATLSRGQPTCLRRVKVGRRQWRSLAVKAPADLATLEKLRQQVAADPDPRRFVIRLRIGGACWRAAEVDQLKRLEETLLRLGVCLERLGDARVQVDLQGLDWTALPSGAVKETLLALHEEWLHTTDESKREMLLASVQLGWDKIQEAAQS